MENEIKCTVCLHYDCKKPGLCDRPEFKWIPDKNPPHKDFKIANRGFQSDIEEHQTFIDTHIAPIQNGRFVKAFCGLNANKSCLTCHHFTKTLPKDMSYRCFGFGGCPGAMLSEEFKALISAHIAATPFAEEIEKTKEAFFATWKKAYEKDYPDANR